MPNFSNLLSSFHCHIQYINILMIACMRTLQLKGLYQFAQVKLYKPHLERYFDNNPAIIEKQMKEISKKYSLNKKAAEKLFRLKPQVFIPGSQERAEIESKITFLNKLEETEPIASVLNDLLFDNHHLIMSMDQEKILEFIKTIKDLGFNDKTAVKLLTSSPNLVHNKFDILYQEKLFILTDYLQLTPAQALEIFLNQPFLLNCSSDRLRQTICYMVERQNKVLTREKIIDLLRNLGEIFLTGREQLSNLIQWYSSWGIQRQELWGILLQHPLLLLNHPSEVFHFKIKMFRQFRFTVDMGQQMLRKYPSILFCSVRSLESKLLCARDRLKINITPHNLEFLTFKFMANIRPRSEMLIRGKVPYTSQDIVEYLKCSQKEFLARTKIPEEKLIEEKGKYLITTELDIPRKKSLKGSSSEKKIFQYSARYYSKEDLILKEK